jgi:hypothetical protein
MTLPRVSGNVQIQPAAMKEKTAAIEIPPASR